MAKKTEHLRGVRDVLAGQALPDLSDADLPLQIHGLPEQLNRLARRSHAADRRQILKVLELGSHHSAFLGRYGAIEPPHGRTSKETDEPIVGRTT